MQSNYRYYVYLDQIDLDDDNEEQASVYQASIESESELEIDQIIQIAEQKADWKIAFGEGDWDRAGTYVIEQKDPAGNLTRIADKYQPKELAA